MVNVVILKLPEVVPAGIVITRGRAMLGSEVLNEIVASPNGATPESVTVQLLLLLETSVAGLHWTDEMFVTPITFRFTLRDVPP